jgi:hypothetical protein
VSRLTAREHNGSTEFESWAKESFEIATKIVYRNDGRIGISKGGNMDSATVTTAPLLPAGYVVSASRIANRRIVLAGYRVADLLTWFVGSGKSAPGFIREAPLVCCLHSLLASEGRFYATTCSSEQNLPSSPWDIRVRPQAPFSTRGCYPG